MLLTHLREVTEIDGKIDVIHRELAALYRTRSLLMGSTRGSSVSMQAPNTTVSPPQKSEQLYRRLAGVWERYNLDIPPYAQIKAKFIKANEILAAITASYPEIAGNFEVVAVPPSKMMAFPIATGLRARQRLCALPDFANNTVGTPAVQPGWQFILAYSANSSLYAGSPKKILEFKTYMLAGYDMRAMGLREYAALTLQKDSLIDEESWTVLLKGRTKNSLIPYVGSRQGRYRFDLEEADNILDDDGFRPAIKL